MRANNKNIKKQDRKQKLFDDKISRFFLIKIKLKQSDEELKRFRGIKQRQCGNCFIFLYET